MTKIDMQNIEKENISVFVTEIKTILEQSRQKAYHAINAAMVDVYWNIGRRIVEQEQKGKNRAEYGSYLLKHLANELSTEFGKGLEERELRKKIRQFFLAFPIRDALRPELTWTH